MLFYTMHLMRERERARATRSDVRSLPSGAGAGVRLAESGEHHAMLQSFPSVSGTAPPGQPVRIQIVKERVFVTYLPVPHEKPVLASLPL